MESKGPVILAIDDKEDVLTALKDFVEYAFPDAGVFTALNGERGIELAIAENPDVILLDILMPGMDGYEVCTELKKDDRLKDIPVIFLTGLKGDSENLTKALESGAEAFLSKPVDMAELTAQIRAMVKIKKAGILKHLEKEELAGLVAERTLELEEELEERKRVEEKLRRSHQKLENARTAMLGLLEDLTEEIKIRKKTEIKLQASRKQLRAFSGYLQEQLEQERSRISREIHDELGQSLTGIKIDVFRFKEDLADEAKLTGHLGDRIDSLIKLTDSTIQATREISLRLRPGILDDLGLAAAVRWQAKQLQEATGIACTAQIDIEKTDISENHTTALFRICQGCLTNIVSHASATKIQITLTEQAGNLTLEVEDNGKGITQEQIRNPTSLGIMGMRERTISVGGTFSISGKPGQGTRVKVEVPVD